MFKSRKKIENINDFLNVREIYYFKAEMFTEARRTASSQSSLSSFYNIDYSILYTQSITWEIKIFVSLVKRQNQLYVVCDELTMQMKYVYMGVCFILF